MTKDKHEYEQPETQVVLAADYHVDRVSAEHYKQQLKAAKELLDRAAKENDKLKATIRSEIDGLKKALLEKKEAKEKLSVLQVEFDTLHEQYDTLQRVNTKLETDKEGVHQINVQLHEQLVRVIEDSIQLEKSKPTGPRMVDPAGWLLDPTVPIPVEERRRIAKNYGFVDTELKHSYKSVYIILIIALTLVAFGVLEVIQ